MLYFRVLADDRRFPNRWFLDKPRSMTGDEIDAREFGYGRTYVGPQPINVPIQQVGSKVAFNLAAFDMPVVTDDIGRRIEAIAPGQVERFPVTVGSSILGYCIFNVVVANACVDEQRSEVTRWRPEDERPNEIGRYRMVSNLTIDPLRAKGCHIFRIKDFEIALIVSDSIKELVEPLSDLGIVFRAVC
jgi:hypothetical protein